VEIKIYESFLKQSSFISILKIMDIEKTTMIISIKLNINSIQLDSEKDRENDLKKLTDEISEILRRNHSCQISLMSSSPGIEVNEGIFQYKVIFVLSGTLAEIMAAKSELLRINLSQVSFRMASFFKSRDCIEARRAILLDSKGEMRAGIKHQLDQIMKDTKTMVTCVGHKDDLGRSETSLQLLGTGLEFEGPEAYIKSAKVKGLVLLDTLVSDFYLIPDRSLFSSH